MNEAKTIDLTHMEAIRLLSGIFRDDVEEMQARLAVCNLIARNSLGMAEDDFTDSQCLQVGIKLKRG